MAEVHVEHTREDTDRFRFDVTVSEGGQSTRHQVTLSRADYERLGAMHGSPDAFVEACFSFLLARESKDSILRSFDVREIGHYFPSFEQEIVQPRQR